MGVVRVIPPGDLELVETVRGWLAGRLRRLRPALLALLYAMGEAFCGP